MFAPKHDGHTGTEGQLPPRQPAREFSQDMLGFVTRSARDYGDVVRLRLVNRTAFMINHPVHIETVLVQQHERFIKHRFFWSRPSSDAEFWTTAFAAMTTEKK